MWVLETWSNQSVKRIIQACDLVTNILIICSLRLLHEGRVTEESETVGTCDIRKKMREKIKLGS